MGVNGWIVADSDMHLMEPADLWTRYIDPAWRHAAPMGLSELQRDMRVRVKNHNLTRTGPVRANPVTATIGWKPQQDSAYGPAEARGWDAVSQLDAMDAEGLDVAVLFPSRGLFVLGLDSAEQMGTDGLEPGFATAISRAYNDWLHDFCAEDPNRLLGAGLLAPHDIDAAIAETRRCVEELGFKTVMLYPGCVNRRAWHDPCYDPLWAECERLGVPISFHGGGQNYLRPDFSLEVFDTMMMWHTFGQPLGIMAVTVSFTGGGVLQRFPNLRVALLEGNCGWAPWLLQRLDEHWEWLGDKDAPDLERAPSEYFRTNCYLSIESDETTAKYFIDWFGDDNLVFSTDYPHGDSKFPLAVANFLKLPIAEESKKKILWENWARLYGLTALPSGAARS
jgi:predicted TIM-barrel fold metal-dependent hydrolase